MKNNLDIANHKTQSSKILNTFMMDKVGRCVLKKMQRNHKLQIMESDRILSKTLLVLVRILKRSQKLQINQSASLSMNKLIWKLLITSKNLRRIHMLFRKPQSLLATGIQLMNNHTLFIKNHITSWSIDSYNNKRNCR